MNYTKLKIQDISSHFSNQALEEILSACMLAKKLGLKISTTLHLFSSLTNNQYIQLLSKEAQFNYSKILELIQSELHNALEIVKIPDGQVHFSPDLKATLIRSFQISQNLSISQIGLEELLLATLYDAQIYKILSDNSINSDSLVNLIFSYKGKSKQKKETDPIDRFSINLTKQPIDKREKIVNRETEYAQLIRVLARAEKNDIILLGEIGVGKSSLVNKLVNSIISGDIPQSLSKFQVLEFNITSFFSALLSHDYTDLQDILIENLRNSGEIILYIKNLQFSTYKNNLQFSILTNLVRSINDLHNIHLIISTDSSSYKKIVSQETFLSDNFEIIKIKEPSQELSIKILEENSKKLSSFHNIEINASVIKACVSLSKRYIQDRFLPSKAIDLLDETCSKVTLENRKKVSIEDVKSVISEKTGIPIEKLTITEQKRLLELENILNQKVIGQKEAVHIVSEVVRRSRAGLKDPKRPIGSFLFLGPSGVGKTYLAKNLTKIIYDNENAMIRLDMSEFSEPHTVQRLIGSPPGYVGYEEGGQLTNPVWERPYSLILLDEIEKAHKSLFDIFLQVLDEGRLTDGQGRTIDFKNTIIIATSNIASDKILDKINKNKKNLSGFNREKFLEEKIMPLMREYFRPEFINRFDEIVIFNPLDIEGLKTIAKLQIKKIQKRLKNKNIKVEISNKRLESIAHDSYNPLFGARPLIRTIQDDIENTIAKKIISGQVKSGDTVNL